jgi:hypothetical protein
MLQLCFIAVIAVATGSFAYTNLQPAHAASPEEVNFNQLNQTIESNAVIIHKTKSSTQQPKTALRNLAAVPQTTTTITLPYNNIGTMMDKGTTNATSSANFDGGGYSYSQNALQASGRYSGAAWYNDSNYYDEVELNGISFDWPDVAYGKADNIIPNNQVIQIPTSANASIIGFIGSATGGSASITVTITYTDGTTSKSTLSFSDWTLGGGKTAILSSDKIAAAMSYRDEKGGVKQTLKTYLFYSSINATAGKTVQSITLGKGPAGRSFHIFAIGTRSSAAPTDFNSAYNNTAVSDNANMAAASFDGDGL